MRSPTGIPRGMTLVELLVAMVLGLLVSLAAMGALSMSQLGFHSVGAASQVRSQARFAADIMHRVIVQAGYLDTPFAIERRHSFALDSSVDSEPSIKGFNNARYNSELASGAAHAVPPSGHGINGSDLLIVRYQADRSTIHCLGHIATAAPATASDRLVSVFHISDSSGEPSLMCSWRNAASSSWQTQPLAEGVERLQILYGTHNVTPNTAPAALSASLPGVPAPPPPDRYLRADQLEVIGDTAATNANWLRVRTLRIGMVVRGPVGSAPVTADGAPIHPFGTALLGSASDVGTQPGPANDGRLRQTVSFTIHLRNPQHIR